MHVVSGAMPRAGQKRGELVGLPALAAAVLKSGLSEPDWFFERPDAVALWCEIGGVEPEHFYRALEGYARKRWVA